MSAMDSRMQHSSYYHKRFEGYMEKYALDANGKRYIERVYTGAYYSQDITDNRRILTRVIYLALYLLAVGLFLFVSSKGTQSNYAVYVQFICFILLVAMSVMLMNLMAYITSPRRMTIWQHFTGPVRVKHWSMVTALLMVIQASAIIIYAIQHQENELSGEIINAVGLLVASLAMFSINRIETKTTYQKTLSEGDPPTG